MNFQEFPLPRRLRVGTSRAVFAAVALCFVYGAFSTATLGCGANSYYSCTNKNNFAYCSDFSAQSACQSRAFCEWREGCASTNPNVVGCRLPSGDAITSADQCLPADACHWQPACWDAPNTECTPSLDEAECTRRNCQWEKHSSQL